MELHEEGDIERNSCSKCFHSSQASRVAEELSKTAASASKKKFKQALSGERMAEAKEMLNESGLDRVADQTKEIADQTKHAISGFISKFDRNQCGD